MADKESFSVGVQLWPGLDSVVRCMLVIVEQNEDNIFTLHFAIAVAYTLMSGTGWQQILVGSQASGVQPQRTLFMSKGHSVWCNWSMEFKNYDILLERDLTLPGIEMQSTLKTKKQKKKLTNE